MRIQVLNIKTPARVLLMDCLGPSSPLPSSESRSWRLPAGEPLRRVREDVSELSSVVVSVASGNEEAPVLSASASDATCCCRLRRLDGSSTAAMFDRQRPKCLRSLSDTRCVRSRCRCHPALFPTRLLDSQGLLLPRLFFGVDIRC